MDNVRMKDRGLDDRPREKLMTNGVRTLSNSEILAILIGSGTVREDALSLSGRILSDMKGSLHDLARLSVEQLCQYSGIGHAKAISIVAALELGRRKDNLPAAERSALRSSRDVYNLMRSTYLDLQHEEAWVLFVDNGLRLISKHMMGKGGLDFTPIDLKIVLRKALECSARSLFLTHNHPSGMLDPSDADIDLTERFFYACSLMDIQMTDHVIFTDSGYTSLRDEGIFEKFA